MHGVGIFLSICVDAYMLIYGCIKKKYTCIAARQDGTNFFAVNREIYSILIGL